MKKPKRLAPVKARPSEPVRMCVPAFAVTRHFYWVAAILVVLTCAVYWPVLHFDFLDYDDPDYVVLNMPVRAGLTWQGVAWAFHFNAANWHPLTWITHMFDCQVFGSTPGKLHGTGGHHLTNLIFHAANGVLLLLLLVRVTGLLWSSAIAAALFALHPIHVESVAWISERKDVLSTFFLMLTLLAYIRYVQVREREKASTGEGGTRPLSPFLSFTLSLLFFALGLMSKQMLVSVPLLLLLLDFWPLRRTQWLDGAGEKVSRLIAEKIPFLVMAIVASVVVVFAQQSGKALVAMDTTPLGFRLGNAVVTYVIYLSQTFWPRALACYYPQTAVDWLAWQIAGSAIWLAAVSFFVIRMASRAPYLLVGWFWYAITLVPVIGLVQVGGQARADRYTYIPLIGIFLLVCFAAHELSARFRPKLSRPILATLSVLVVGTLSLLARTQVNYWQNDETLWTHTLAITEKNWFGHQALAAIFNREATVYSTNGERDKAAKRLQQSIDHLRAELEIKPGLENAHTLLANALLELGKVDDAIKEYEIALQLSPNDVFAHENIANALSKKGRLDEAIEHYRLSLKADEKMADTHYNLARVLQTRGRNDEAIAEYRRALELYPRDLTGYWSAHALATLLASKGQTAEAIQWLQQAVQVNERSKVDTTANAAANELKRLQRTTAERH